MFDFEELGKQAYMKKEAVGVPPKGALKYVISKGFGKGQMSLDTAKKVLIGGAVMLGLGTAFERAGRVGYSKLTKNKNFNNALDFDPEAARHYKKDPKRTEAVFNTLHKFNPDAASDPLVASSWIRQTMEQPILPVKSVEEATKAVRKEPFAPQPMLPRAVKSLSGVAPLLKTVGETVEAEGI